MTFDMYSHGILTTMKNTIVAIQEIERLSKAVSPSSLEGLRGNYVWNTLSGQPLFVMSVDTRIYSNTGVSVGECGTEISLAEGVIADLASKTIDPLTLINTGKLRIRALANSSKDGEKEGMRLLNLIFNNTSLDGARRSEIEFKSVQGADFKRCDVRGESENIEGYFRRGEPFIITEVCCKWPLFKMTLSEIFDVLGELEVSLLVKEHDFVKKQPPSYEKSSFFDYVNALYSDKGEVSGYMAANSVPQQLKDTYLYPEVFSRAAFNTPRWWIGPAGSGLRLHRDLVDNFLCQLKGRKRIRLYAPSETGFLYPVVIGSNALYEPSMVDPDNYEGSDFPLFSRARYVDCELGAGDLLYLPAGWWHHVHNIEVSWSLNFFAVNQAPCVLS
ncbi:cupin-like domain-containing protein [Pseudomonas brassicacearum]|nr:cupin-like domain-containing protein [Pseudomonas brassicacearum]